jgi:hypothetical protein
MAQACARGARAIDARRYDAVARERPTSGQAVIRLLVPVTR